MSYSGDSGSKIKKFVDWVNADENLPTLEELGYSHDDQSDTDHDHHHDIHEPNQAALEAAKSAWLEEIENYEGDDEFEYPDEVAHVDEQPELDAALPGDEDFIAHHESVHMTKKMKVQMKRFRIFYLILSGIVAFNVTLVMLVTVAYLPEFGSAYGPTVNEVYTRYVERGLEDTGALNLVAAVLFSYRSFDTLGEAFVLFTAVIGVMLLMRRPSSDTKSDAKSKG